MTAKALRLYDNTRLSDYKRCPRLYFFRHVLDWRPAGSAVPLIFGGAWHSAMEVVWANIKTMERQELVTRAYGKFLETWCGSGMPAPSEIDYEMEKELSPRTPGQALEMIIGYIDVRKPHAEDFEVLAIEQPFIVPLDPRDDTLFYVGKIDKIVLRQKKILGIEHKTTTAYRKDKSQPFRAGFLDSFSPNAQVDGYLYALHLMHPGNVGGVWVDAALVHKSEEGFTFIPIEKQLRHLDAWLWETRRWIGLVEHDAMLVRQMGTQGPGYPHMEAFPKNTNSCWDFNHQCAYLDLCKSWPNPLGYEMPAGFKKEHWDPLDHIKGLDKVVEAA